MTGHIRRRGERSWELKYDVGADPVTGLRYSLYPRSAGSWPGYVFTGDPLRVGAGQVGLGYGSGAHAPDEYYIIESRGGRVAGLRESAMGFVDFLYEMARIR